MESKKYVRLSYSERVKIQTLLEENRSRIYIAQALNRNRSTISRELSKWIKKPNDKYEAYLAHFFAEDDKFNKRNLDKISTHNCLKMYVYRNLLRRNSPEQIAGRIKLDYPNNLIMRISYEAIYTHIYNFRHGKMRRKLISLLHYSKSKRKSRKGAKTNRQRIKEANSIEDRPIHIEDRKEVGHWEGDLIIGPKQSSAIGTLVERKTRFVYIVKLKNRKSETVTKAFKKSINRLDTKLRKTLTYDNGMEMANHKWFTKHTGAVVYFAHPYSSWERGSNENTNGLIRRYFPKNTDFNKLSENQLKEVENMLNNRPRKILGYYTANEKMNEERLALIRGYSDNFLSPNAQKKLSEITCT
jgi:transposase, IS30 family